MISRSMWLRGVAIAALVCVVIGTGFVSAAASQTTTSTLTGFVTAPLSRPTPALTAAAVPNNGASITTTSASPSTDASTTSETESSSFGFAPGATMQAQTIEGINASTTDTSATLFWQTPSEVSSADLLYGTSTTYTATSTSDLSVDHSVTLSNLSPDTIYHFEIVSTESNMTSSSPDETFQTTGAALPSSDGDSKPQISDITVMPTYSIATISWTTDIPSTSLVWYGTSSQYSASTTGAADLSAMPTTNHVVSIGNLSPGITYHFEIISENSAGASESIDQTFTTMPLSQ